FSQMKKLANMDINSLMAAGDGGLPNMPAMPGIPTGNLPGLPKGYTPPGSKSLVGAPRPIDKARARDKRKAEKAARKKNRK
ncbi:MAG TPA: signal recognition particle protein, partial [Kofleriaceae bacterium]|nr:signal recognition particle protein [Kofleriaceae bacterium]